MGNQCSRLQDELSNLKKNKKILEKRLSQLSVIEKNVESGLLDESREVNRHSENVKAHLEKGLKGVNSNLSSGLDKYTQHNPSSDSYLRDCENNIRLDISNCKRQIDSLDSNIFMKQQEIDILSSNNDRK